MNSEVFIPKGMIHLNNKHDDAFSGWRIDIWICPGTSTYRDNKLLNVHDFSLVCPRLDAGINSMGHMITAPNIQSVDMSLDPALQNIH